MSIRDSLKNTFNRENIVAKTNDMKAGAQIGASKDMLRVARDSKEPMGAALNAQKDDKGVAHAGNYRYKTDALVLMLDGLMAKLNPNAGRASDKAIKQRSTALLTDIRTAGLASKDFRGGIKNEIGKIMERERALTLNPKGKSTGKAAAFDNKEFKILEEVLTTLGTRMSPQNDDKFGLNKKRPTEATESDRSYGAQTSSKQAARHTDEQALDAGRDKRAYHKQVGNAVKNLGGALKGTVRSTGAALRTYTEAPRRQAAIGGLVAAEKTAEAGQKIADASKEIVKNLDVAQAHALGRVEAAAEYVATAVGKTGKDLGKATARVGRDLAQGVKDVHVHGADKFGSKVEKRVEAAKARAGRGKTKTAEAPSAPKSQASERPSLSRSSTSTSSLSAASERPSLSRSSTSTSSLSAASERPSLSRSSTSSSSLSAASTTGSFKSAKSNLSTSDSARRTQEPVTPKGPNRPSRR